LRRTRHAATFQEINVKSFKGQTLSWEWREGVLEIVFDHAPANEIGTLMVADLEKFVAAIPTLAKDTAACIFTSARKQGFSAGGDLRELYQGAIAASSKQRSSGVRRFLKRIHAVGNAIDAAPFVTIAAVHGVCFGGGFELALMCDIIVADKMARFAFPELRLGFIPGFGGIPRLKRDASNAFARDLLFTGRTVNAARLQACGVVSQLAGEGEALRIARSIAAQTTKYDSEARNTAKKFLKPIPYADLKRETDIFCKLFARPTVLESLKKFLESSDAMPYLP
jgi:enoyl-CoA hydratase/carnithine racemase